MGGLIDDENDFARAMASFMVGIALFLLVWGTAGNPQWISRRNAKQQPHYYCQQCGDSCQRNIPSD